MISRIYPCKHTILQLLLINQTYNLYIHLEAYKFSNYLTPYADIMADFAGSKFTLRALTGDPGMLMKPKHTREEPLPSQ